MSSSPLQSRPDATSGSPCQWSLKYRSGNRASIVNVSFILRQGPRCSYMSVVGINGTGSLRIGRLVQAVLSHVPSPVSLKEGVGVCHRSPIEGWNFVVHSPTVKQSQGCPNASWRR